MVRECARRGVRRLGLFGRSELARIMREVFDEDRRRERSGSFSGPVNMPPSSGPVTPIPLVASGVQRNSTSVLDEGQQTPAYVPDGALPAPSEVALEPRPSRASLATVNRP